MRRGRQRRCGVTYGGAGVGGGFGGSLKGSTYGGSSGVAYGTAGVGGGLGGSLSDSTYGVSSGVAYGTAGVGGGGVVTWAADWAVALAVRASMVALQRHCSLWRPSQLL